jgi:hypothetical protein
MSTPDEPPSHREMNTDIPDALSERPSGLIYHYTTQSGLLGIIEHREIWATHFRHLNDTQEFHHAWKLLRDRLSTSSRPSASQLLEAITNGHPDPGEMFVASFSEKRDSLPQWRAYAHSEPGYSLGFHADEAQMVLPHYLYMVRCVYGDAEQRKTVDDHVNTVLTDPPEDSLELAMRLNLSGFNVLALSLKDKSFEEEKEWRIVSENMTPRTVDDEVRRGLNYSETPLCFRNGTSGIIPYRKVKLEGENGCFPLAQIVVGPCPDKERSVKSVESFLASKDLRSVPVIPSDVPYRSW